MIGEGDPGVSPVGDEDTGEASSPDGEEDTGEDPSPAGGEDPDEEPFSGDPATELGDPADLDSERDGCAWRPGLRLEASPTVHLICT
jgi:hypothetical protein